MLNYSKRSKRPERLLCRRIGLEQLEDRTVPTTTLFLDFGAGVGVGNTISIAAEDFRDIFGPNTGTDLGTDSMGNPNPFLDTDTLDFTPLSYDFDGNGSINNADLTALANAVVPNVQRALEPFDIDIVVVSANTFNDAVTSVGNNAGDADGEFDAYVFIMSVSSGGVGISSGLFGQAAVLDLGAQTGNNNDEASITFADNVFGSTPGTQGTAAFNANLAQRLAYTATHEGFHTFSYVHTPDESSTMPQASANQRLLASGDVIRRGSATRDNPFIVTRYDLLHQGAAVPEPNNYLLIANDADIGLRDSNGNNTPDLAYVTGTGANDIVSLTDAGGGVVNVNVSPFSNQARSTAIGAGESYTIDLSTDTDGEILIDASINADQVIIDATINASFRARGGIGADSSVSATADQDLITLNSGGLSGTFTPDPDGINGTVTYAGGATIDFSEFEDADADNVSIDTVNLTLSSGNMVDEGETFTLTVEFINLDTLDQHTVMVDWGNGDTSMVILNPGDRDAVFLYAYADDHPMTGTASDGFTISVTVEDEDGDSGSANAGIVVNNVAPVITTFESDATFDDKAEEGEPVTVTGAFTDIGVLDTHTAEVDWGDGSPLETITLVQGAGAGTFTGSHSYAFGGIYTITVTLTDDDTGVDTAQTLAVVTGVGLNMGVLYIVGSNNGDHVNVHETGNGKTRVHADFIPEAFRDFNTADIDHIIAYLCKGDDHMNTAGNVTTRAVIHGGAGDDHLNGGRLAMLLGDAGNDTLIGQSGRNVLIGGTGNDRLIGGSDQDVLIGGSTTDDEDDAALLALLAVWGDTTSSYDARILAFNALITVLDDGEQDILNGAGGRDLFYDGLMDRLLAVKKDETVN